MSSLTAAPRPLDITDHRNRLLADAVVSAYLSELSPSRKRSRVRHRNEDEDRRRSVARARRARVALSG